MPGTPILSQIMTSMEEMILGITLGLYNFTWDVNKTDLAKASFPVANIFLDNEVNLDDPQGPDSDMYFEEVNFRIEIYTRLETEMANPRWEIQLELNKALDDLKMVFGRDYTINNTADYIMYRGMVVEWIMNNDIMIPGKMITRWRVTYESDRQNPDSVA